MIARILSLSMLGVVACAACANEPAKRTQPREARMPAAQPAEPAANAPQASLPEALLSALRADVAKRTSLAPEAISVASAEKVTWPNGALGCEQPGHMYTQALVPGYRVLMRAGQQLFVYHASEAGALKTCAAGERRQPLRPTVAE